MAVAEPRVHSPDGPSAPLCSLEPPPAGDINLCPSWGRAQGVLAQLRAHGRGSITRMQATGSHTDISHPQQTLLKKNPREIHDLPWGDAGGPCTAPHFFIPVTGEKPGSVAVGGFPSLPGKPLQQPMCCRRRGQVSRAGEKDVPHEALGQTLSPTFNKPREIWDTAFPVRHGGGKTARTNMALFSHKVQAKPDFAEPLPRSQASPRAGGSACLGDPHTMLSPAPGGTKANQQHLLCEGEESSTPAAPWAGGGFGGRWMPGGVGLPGVSLVAG